MEKQVTILSLENITHDVLQIKTEKPANLTFVPGQATEISIAKNDWKDEKRPFTFTSLPQDKHLEFTIKVYPQHNGVTNELLKLQKGDKLILHDVFGAIAYKGEGVFIAGGAGITPFISILRELDSKGEIGNNRLVFANNTEADIILKKEFDGLLDKKFINILSEEKTREFEHGHITEGFLKRNIPENHPFIYLCGPPPMMEAIEKQLKNLNIPENKIVKEEF
ncbi:MAG TPA: FAD-binding oxidoreductase [Flavobacteriaceae bacterium]|nr:FAD-binding oxidoreductase [Flavobacteriaceae bacterium]